MATHTGKAPTGPSRYPPGRVARPRRRFDLVAIAASAGGLKALSTILGGLGADFPVPIAIVQHRTAKLPNLLPEVLGRYTPLRVKLVHQSETLHAGTVYVAPPDQHMAVDARLKIALHDGRKIRHVLSSANPLFSSAAAALDGRVIGVVLTGGDSDATDGVQSIHERGGLVLAQDRQSSEHFGMPGSAIATGCVDRVLPVEEIAAALERLLRRRRRKAAAPAY